MNELSALLEEKMDIYGHFGLQLMIVNGVQGVGLNPGFMETRSSLRPEEHLD
jgi:hypothetical protein